MTIEGSAGIGRVRRVAVWGAPGSGKTTLARRLAERLGVQHVELDALHWGPGWTPVDTPSFRAQVAAASDAEGWVIDGEYLSKAADLVCARADVLVWLDYPLPLLFWRLVRRTVQRVWRREELWNGNREDLRGAFLSRDSLVVYLLRTERAKRRRREALAAEFAAGSLRAAGGLRVVRLRGPREADAWLAHVAVQACARGQ